MRKQKHIESRKKLYCCHDHCNEDNFVIDQIALTAVGHPDLFYGLNRMNTAKHMLRPLLRMAYPTMDESLPFNATREATMSGSDGEDDDLLISKDAFSPRDNEGHKLFVFDLSLLEGTLQDEGIRLGIRISEIEAEKRKEKRTERAIKEKSIKQESVEDSCYFVDEFLKEGLMDFACDLVGLNDAVDDAVSFQSSLAKQNLALAVSLTTFNDTCH